MVRSNANDESKRKKKLLVCLVVGALIFIFIIVPSAMLTGLWISRQKRAEGPPQVKVPNVVGQDYRKGEALLKEKGLGMKVLATRSDQNQPVDVILDQIPRGGESVDLGHTVRVVIGGVFGGEPPTPQR